MLPIRIETYKMELKNGQEEEPEFKFSHELTNYWDMHDLSPSSFDLLSKRFLNEEKTANLYEKTKN